MLEFAPREDQATLRLLVLHDDDRREFAWTEGAERALTMADGSDWTVMSMTHDWATVF